MDHASIPVLTRLRKEKSAPQRAMEKLGLYRDLDLALHLPLRYEDETRLTPVAQLRNGQTSQVEGIVVQSEVQLRTRRQFVVRLIDDAGDEFVLRFLNFYPSHQKLFISGRKVRVRGEARVGFMGAEMLHPTFKSIDKDEPLAAALTPIYPSSAALPQVYLRKAIASALKRADLNEILPPKLIPQSLPTLRESLLVLHNPSPDLSLNELESRSHPAWQRLKFDELLAQQISQQQAKAKRALQRAPAFSSVSQNLRDLLLRQLPFELTAAQQRVVQEITSDLQKPIPMHRLLQGDVGSGKTVVAALSAACVIEHGWQCALMAPTEILAEQHFNKLVSWVQPLGIEVAWLTGSRKGKKRLYMLERIEQGHAGLVVGTHAVIQEDVQFARLGLAIIDEQHRFGVAQRLALRQKLQKVEGVELGLEPHLLMMSATPIPRTLAMTTFADLDISTIDKLPPGRTPIITKVFSDQRRSEVIQHVTDEIDKGRQVYWVCPLIEESEKLDLQNATDTHHELSSSMPHHVIGLIHGRMNSTDKAQVMAQFTLGQTKLLVSTTVIEVGVDVPNASLMIIEHAERFGLSQLHQLRGRVGRGSIASVCVLMFSGPLSVSGKERLRAMAQTTDGFEIARRDLEIRGPGEFLGARQSGVPLLRFADLQQDLSLIQQARRTASMLLQEQPELARHHLQRWSSINAEYLKA
jgi:ATP-dependent DNA helicase RecG